MFTVQKVKASISNIISDQNDSKAVDYVETNKNGADQPIQDDPLTADDGQLLNVVQFGQLLKSQM